MVRIPSVEVDLSVTVVGWCWPSRIRKEGNVLFNDTLNTFYLRLYGKGPLR